MKLNIVKQEDGGSSKDKRKSSLLKDVLDSIEQNLKTHHILSDTASVDSELMLVKAKAYRVEGWISNPYFLGFKDKDNLIRKEEVLMVSRLDGPSAGIVR